MRDVVGFLVISFCFYNADWSGLLPPDSGSFDQSPTLGTTLILVREKQVEHLVMPITQLEKRQHRIRPCRAVDFSRRS